MNKLHTDFDISISDNESKNVHFIITNHIPVHNWQTKLSLILRWLNSITLTEITRLRTFIIVSRCHIRLGEYLSVAIYIFDAHSALNSGSAVSKKIMISFDMLAMFV